MEKQFRINWPAIVCEAKQRRRTQNITQVKLAKLAGVSTPTVSRFESGEENIELSSVLNILQVLGMKDSRKLEFTDSKVSYDSVSMVVVFFGTDKDKKITCKISFEALEDHFGGDDLKNFTDNRKTIEDIARRKYLSNLTENDGSILIESEDL